MPGEPGERDRSHRREHPVELVQRDDAEPDHARGRTASPPSTMIERPRRRPTGCAISDACAVVRAGAGAARAAGLRRRRGARAAASGHYARPVPLACPEPSLPRRVLGERPLQLVAVEVRPQPVGEVELRVGGLPEQEVRQALLAAGADDELGIAASRARRGGGGTPPPRRPRTRSAASQDLGAPAVVEGDEQRPVAVCARSAPPPTRSARAAARRCGRAGRRSGAARPSSCSSGHLRVDQLGEQLHQTRRPPARAASSSRSRTRTPSARSMPSSRASRTVRFSVSRALPVPSEHRQPLLGRPSARCRP